MILSETLKILALYIIGFSFFAAADTRPLSDGRLREWSESLPAVSTQRIRAEFAAYYLAWNRELNPEGLPITVTYGAMGADVLMPLLIGNPRFIHALDQCPISLEQLQLFLDHWAALDTVGLTGNEEGSVTRALYDALRFRRQAGYWVGEDISVFGWARLLLFELKLLGVDRSKIHVSNDGRRLRLDFEWAFPGEAPKPRTLLLTQTELPLGLQALDAPDLSPTKIYIQKGGPKLQRDREYFEAAYQKIPVGSTLLWGFDMVGPPYSMNLNRPQALPGYDPIPLGVERFETEVYSLCFEQLLAPDFEYGWKLFQRRKPPSKE
jgi:hypothetical protein